MNATVQRTLSEWAINQKKALPSRILRLISLANFDLYYGPPMDYDEDTSDGSKVIYPGFTATCREISAALEDLIQDVWVDNQSETVETSEPQGYDDDGEWVEPCWEDYTLVDAKQVKRALVGSELAKHI